MKRRNAVSPISGVYAITPQEADTRELLDKVSAALSGGVRLVQYRNKTAPRTLRLAQARALRKACDRFGASLLINDDWMLALECRANGVHLGRDDASLVEARRGLGTRYLIGISCYAELERARQAAMQGADYVAFGSFFPSLTKPQAPPAPLSLLGLARQAIQLPIVAIGGVTVGNTASLIAGGADAIALVAGLFEAADIQSRARQLVETATAALAARSSIDVAG
jgi:thiamine-phosphate pyrophosphorylase